MKNLKFIKVDDDLMADVELLAREIWQEHYIPIIGEAQVEYMLDKFQSKAAISKQIQEGCIYYLINTGMNRHIGYLSVLVKGDELFFSRVYIKLVERGKGFGRQAIEFVTDLARRNGCFKITLTVNKNNVSSIKAYQKCEFKIVGPIIQDIGNGFVMDDYKMEKTVQFNEESDIK